MLLSDQLCEEINFHVHLKDRGGVNGFDWDQIVWDQELDIELEILNE